MENLIYVGVLLLIGLIGFGGIWLKRRLNIRDDENTLLKLILQVANHVTSLFEFKFKYGVSTVIVYCLEAVDFIEKLEDVSDIEIKIELIKEKALIICEKNNIPLDGGTIEIVDEIVNYLVEQKIIAWL